MLANALASRLGKKILLINFPNLGDNSAGAIVKMVCLSGRQESVRLLMQ